MKSEPNGNWLTLLDNAYCNVLAHWSVCQETKPRQFSSVTLLYTRRNVREMNAFKPTHNVQ